MLLHVEECDRCRKRMDDLSADSHHWQKTIKALSNRPGDEGNQPLLQERYAPAVPHSMLAHEAVSKLLGAEQLAQQLLSPPSHPEMLGRLGRYEVERLIGAGGMGVVFKAFDTELNRPVAIKVLAPHLASCGSARQRFAREAKAAAAVVNDHVVPIHNVEIEGETPFLVMKYIDGESLQARLDREGPLELEEILRIVMQVAVGLAAAHQQGLVHRDIKPANILLEHGLERALITDFGLARAVDDANLTNSGFHAGTPQYMSPEQVAGQTVDCSSDLYSLGSVLYALCTGRPPFRAENSFGVMKRITEDTPRPIHETNPRIPIWLDCIANRLLAKRPDQRPQSAALASELFAQCLKHVQNSSDGKLPSMVVAWMNEANAARVQLPPHENIARRIASGLSQRRRLVFAVCVTMVLGAWGLLQWTPNMRSTVKNTHPVAPTELQATPNAADKLPPTPSTAMDQHETFDPDLEWDAAIQATRTLQLEADALERKLRQ